MTKLVVLVALLFVLLALGTYEGVRHRRNLARIRHRIHVNGTRGKSSVARLIAGGLRAGGLVTCAKTTGTAPTLILPDGSEYGIYRPGSANIIEQVRMVDAAVDAGAEVLVVECMALQPLLQALSETRLVRATHGVITNIRPDHLDVMGPEERDVALAMAGSVPVGGTLYTAADRHLDVLERAAEDRGTKVESVGPAEIEKVSDEEMRRFSYLEHKANVALSLRVCEELGVERSTALEGMWSARPDPGVLTIHEVTFFGRRLLFANGFAANDPESSGQIWQQVLDLAPDVNKRIALFNCRVDRPERSRQLGEACVDWEPADAYVLTGTGTYIFAAAATRRGLDVRKLVIVENQGPAEVFEVVLEHAGDSTLIMGMGNVHGGGEEIARFFRNRGTLMDLHEWS